MSPSFLRRLTGSLWLMLAAALSACVLLGFGGAVARFLLKHAGSLGAGWGIAIAYVAVAAGLLVWSWRAQGRHATRTWLFFVLAVSALVRLALVLLYRDLPQTADRLFILEFVDRWVRDGDTALRQMSHEYYDYPLWTGRAWPVLYPLRVLFPGSFVLATQLANVVLSTALIAAVFAVVRSACGPRMARLAAAFTALSPAFAFSVLDYGYQFQGALLVLATLACMAAAIRRTGQGRRAMLPAGLLVPLLFLLHLQQGLDLLLLAVAAGAVALSILLGRGWRVSGRLALWLLAPALLAAPFSRMADAWFQARDEARMSSHLIGHAALGWNLVTWGEFHGTYLELDRSAPRDRKGPTMTRAVLSNIRLEPVRTLAMLPAVKIVKFMQVGAATGIEEAFQEAGAVRGALALRATRVVYALLLLAAAAIGTFALIRRPRVGARMLWALFLAGTLAAYTFMSETSPRYSFYVHFVIAAAAAQGLVLALRARPALTGARGWKHWTAGAFGAFALMALALASIGWIVQRLPAQRFFLDLRAVTRASDIVEAGREPWDVVLKRTGELPLRVPVTAAREELSFFAWSGREGPATCVLEVRSAGSGAPLGRVDLTVGSRCTFGTLELKRTAADERMLLRFTTPEGASVRWGFASLEPAR